MATSKKNNYIDQELDWLEGKAEEIRSYCDDRPYNTIIDRIAAWKDTTKGPIPVKVVTIEEQQTAQRAALKDYVMLVEAINKLREAEDQKKQLVRGDEQLSPMEDGSIRN